ncbi:hypothetical protein K402DRAFT_412014 [Aulographum hederae CBS 113979]|uniref:Uncharacterized protein n=1 Tax=Aulographum hederae CBS 113979 TaxID=1176131 RepID=A0A6G1H400_9PEZI|nr:hypothetical protein K402DRAFT_412014 [Aulographum hederae CBS 113979]
MATTQKPQLASINTMKTPLSATYPSELRSPQVGSPAFIKREDSQKTPITPPAAYLDFLKTLSPTLMSPLSAGGATRKSFSEKPAALLSNHSSDSVQTLSTDASDSSSSTITRTSSMDSAAPILATASSSKPSSRSSSCSSISRDAIDPALDSIGPCKSTTTSTSTSKHPTGPPADMKITIPPASPFVRPLSLSARTPRRLHIPQSPYSAGAAPSPLSAGARSVQSIYSPYSATMSPRDWELERGPSTGGSGRVNVKVRQVVTRTVTYSRQPGQSVGQPLVDPVPANKKRKIEESR